MTVEPEVEGRTTAAASAATPSLAVGVAMPSPQPSPTGRGGQAAAPRPQFPFSAIVGQEHMKRALILNAINPSIGGVLIRGEKGTAKSTAARSLARLLPSIVTIPGCAYACEVGATLGQCVQCTADEPPDEPVERAAPLVTLPLGATEDRVLGTLDLERAIQEGKRSFEPGLLAAAHRGILYIDEVNLLSDHLVDVLLDTAAMGVNVVEREGISVQHPARFMLVGTMNPEEGELRPQLLDRFGLAVEVGGMPDPAERAQIVRRRIAFEADPVAFARTWQAAEDLERERIQAATTFLPSVRLSERMLDLITRLCSDLQVDGLRADIVIYKTALTLAAYDHRPDVTDEDVRQAAELALPHRRRRGPFQQPHLDPQELDDAFDRARESSNAADDSHGDEATEEHGDGPDEVFAIGPTPPLTLPSAPRLSGELAGRRVESAVLEQHGQISRVKPLHQTTSRSLALGATLRAAAPYQLGRVTDGSLALQIRRQDVHVNERSGPTGSLVLFVVDSSGSMAAGRRMERVKGAVMGLLTDAYQKRDQVGIIAFRGARAELLLAPTSSVDRAERCLSALPTGGRTPLADGLRLALDTLAHSASLTPFLILITDGRPNIALQEA
ncbi:MAG: VWA domain-containing protein, partial [Chloroflexota bacterium]